MSASHVPLVRQVDTKGRSFPASRAIRDMVPCGVPEWFRKRDFSYKREFGVQFAIRLPKVAVGLCKVHHFALQVQNFPVKVNIT